MAPILLSKICFICLCTDTKINSIVHHDLSDFYDEICEFETAFEKLVACTLCTELLKKCYRFKKQCIRANSILKEWSKIKVKNRPPITELTQKLNNATNRSKTLQQSHITCDIMSELKKEICTNHLKNGNDVTSSDEDHDIPETTSDDDDEDNKCLSDLIENVKFSDINIVKEEFNSPDNRNETKLHDENGDKCVSDLIVDVQFKGNMPPSVKNGNSKKKTIDVNCKDNEIKTKNKLRKPRKKASNINDMNSKSNEEKKNIGSGKPAKGCMRKRKPLVNRELYEKVFDVTQFLNEADIVKEIESRKTSDKYLTAQFKCDICFLVYSSKKYLEYHKKWHEPTAGDFICNFCSMRFKNIVLMRKHKLDGHYGLFKCKICPLVTYHRVVMINHFRKHQGVQHKCKLCPNVYNHVSTYLTHLRKAHKSEHICGTCAQSFVSAIGLSLHYKKVHGSNMKLDDKATVKCEECNLSFINEEVYVIHVMNTPKHKSMALALTACKECGKKFEDKSALKTHRRMYHFKPAYGCNAKKKMDIDTKDGDATTYKPVQKCPICHKTGNYNTWLYQHFLAEHPGVNYYQQLYHVTKKRNHLCEQCGMSFFNATRLREHTYIHTGDLPFQCGTCSRKFRTKSSYFTHKDWHLPPSRSCPHCGKKFVSASNLSNHIRQHIGDRRYICKICSKGFIHSSSLNEHVRGVHHHIRRQRKSK